MIDVVKGTIEDAAKGTLRRNGEVSAGRAHEWLDVAGAATGVLTYEGHLARVLEEGRNKVAARETRRRDETIEIFALEGVFFIKDMIEVDIGAVERGGKGSGGGTLGAKIRLA